MIYRNKALVLVLAASAWMTDNTDANNSRFAAAFAPSLPKYAAHGILANQDVNVGRTTQSNTWYVGQIIL